LYFSIAKKTTPTTVSPLYVEYAKPTGRECIAFAIQTIVMHMNSIHKTEGASLEKPSETLAKLLDAIPHETPSAKKRYPRKGFINLS